MLSERQETLLNFIVKEYLTLAGPVGSLQLKKSAKLDVSPATVRNDLQELTDMGYIRQLHTSGGRVPTEKAYRYLAQKFEKPSTFYDVPEVNVVRMSIVRRVRFAHEEIEQEMKKMQELMDTLESDNFFDIFKILDQWNKMN